MPNLSLSVLGGALEASAAKPTTTPAAEQVGWLRPGPSESSRSREEAGQTHSSSRGTARETYRLLSAGLWKTVTRSWAFPRWNLCRTYVNGSVLEKPTLVCSTHSDELTPYCWLSILLPKFDFLFRVSMEGSRMRRQKVEKMADKPSKPSGLVNKPVPMRLFATWEVEKSSPNCIPRWDMLVIVYAQLEQSWVLMHRPKHVSDVQTTFWHHCCLNDRVGKQMGFQAFPAKHP